LRSVERLFIMFTLHYSSVLYTLSLHDALPISAGGTMMVFEEAFNHSVIDNGVTAGLENQQGKLQFSGALLNFVDSTKRLRNPLVGWSSELQAWLCLVQLTEYLIACGTVR